MNDTTQAIIDARYRYEVMRIEVDINCKAVDDFIVIDRATGDHLYETDSDSEARLRRDLYRIKSALRSLGFDSDGVKEAVERYLDARIIEIRITGRATTDWAHVVESVVDRPESASFDRFAKAVEA